MSGSPGNGLVSNIPGTLEVCVTDTLDVSDGTNQIGGSGAVLGSVTFPLVRSVSEIDWLSSSRGSMNRASGAAPLLVNFTGTVTGVPDASFVDALSGRPDALADTSLNAMLPLNESDCSLPSTAPEKSTISVQVPDTGLRVFAVADFPFVPLKLLEP